MEIRMNYYYYIIKGHVPFKKLCRVSLHRKINNHVHNFLIFGRQCLFKARNTYFLDLPLWNHLHEPCRKVLNKQHIVHKVSKSFWPTNEQAQSSVSV